MWQLMTSKIQMTIVFYHMFLQELFNTTWEEYTRVV
ncbi:hypothetical protein Gotur_032334 [Gossypium turneri]